MNLKSLFRGKNDNASTQNTHNQPENNKQEKDSKQKIFNLIIVDESGSMGHLRESTLSGVNEVISTISEAQKEYAETQTQYLTLVTFDTGGNRQPVRTIIDCEPIEKVKDFNDYTPCGCTPLYDAMGESLTRMRHIVGDDVNSSVVVTVMTDGLENSSTQWNPKDLRKLIEQLKELGWSFSYMGSAHDVKEVTDLLAIDNFVEFAHSKRGTNSSWAHESSSRKAYYRKMAASKEMFLDMSEEEIISQKKAMAQGYYGNRVTPDHISKLMENEVFVFGSNPDGQHNGGASRQAVDMFGAEMGNGEGPQGQSYAIPTTGGIQLLVDAIYRFTGYAAANPDKHFYVTPIGCGSAGFTPADIAPLFADCIKLENVALPRSFWAELGVNQCNI